MTWFLLDTYSELLKLIFGTAFYYRLSFYICKKEKSVKEIKIFLKPLHIQIQLFCITSLFTACDVQFFSTWYCLYLSQGGWRNTFIGNYIIFESLREPLSEFRNYVQRAYFCLLLQECY